MAQAQPTPDEGPLTHRQTLLVLSGLLLGMLLAALDQMIVTTALPTIVRDLHGLQHMSWVVTAYLLASTILMPLYGKLGDLIGRKPIFLFVIVIFLAGSILCGTAQSMTELIAFRAIQGLGGGGLMITAMAIIGDVVPPRQRGKYQGLFGAVFGLASIAGPLVGGWFTQNLSWRWIFYINMPIGAAALIVTFLFLKNTRRAAGRPSIDYPGAILIGAAVTCIVLLTSWGGDQYAWSSPVIIGLGVAGAVLLAVFGVVERKAKQPIIPLHLFANRTFDVSSTVSFFVGFAMFGAVAFLPLFLQIVSGASATNSGLLLLPFMGGVIVSSMTSGQIITRTGKYRLFPAIGTGVASVGMFLLSTMNVNTTRFTSSLFMVVLGVGLGLVMQVVILATQNTVAREDMGAGTSTVTFARQIGASFGVSIFGAIFNAKLKDAIGHVPLGTGAGSPQLSSISRAQIDKLPGNVRDVVLHAFSHSLTQVFFYGVPFMVVAFIVAWFMKGETLRGATPPTDEQGEVSDVSAAMH